MKKTLALILSFIMLLTALPFVVSAETRDTSFENGLAETLRDLGLFKGVSETNFALDRAPTRIEALVMLIRTLGKESEALGSSFSHPFTDVPSWADKYVGYAYGTKLTNGVSSDKFGSGDASAAMFITFVLRSLGYSDANNADFTWSNPYDLAEDIKILPENVNRDKFWRADVATVSYAALNAKLKDSDETLAEKLISVGAVDEDKFNEIYDADKLTPFFEEIKEEIPSREIPQPQTPDQSSGKYVLNNHTKKIHYEKCDSVADIKPENIGFTDTPDYYLTLGYAWCKKCHG